MRAGEPVQGKEAKVLCPVSLEPSHVRLHVKDRTTTTGAKMDGGAFLDFSCKTGNNPVQHHVVCSEREMRGKLRVKEVIINNYRVCR